ncbi:Flagellar transcriptional regulator ftcR [Hyphomicrobium sp. GJ21]|jgi:DNA-binding response OmpR family regulator|uniref:response regulator transcription factor n=1 Tax=Hyphomicrobium sp. GJ21 TaxID=113574 RepID=UPI000622BFA8|nr:response regulator transcription factor [Hyphomicrobium sp. GJ21]CEJ87391.1 Flagellar transcriptional regulator ftcR [Hyphomicrobium sp. GJ21]
MFVVLDDRSTVAGGCVACFEREGIAAVAVESHEFPEWFESVNDSDLSVIEGFLIGSVEHRRQISSRIRSRCRAPLIGLIEARALNETLELFSLGFDDVLAKPFHVREVLARSGAIRRRMKMAEQCVDIAGIRIFFDGRDPLVNGEVLSLPRRERRILECLVLSRNTRVTKTQIFNRVYGIFNDEIHENVIESHISRLRKRLKQRLGHDPIDSQRFLGYRLKEFSADEQMSSAEEAANSLTQGPNASLEQTIIPEQESVDGPLRINDYQHLRHGCPV